MIAVVKLEVASFWYGSPLSYVERACIQSFLDHGFDFHFYSLDSKLDAPEGVILHDANDVYDSSEFLNAPSSRHRAAAYSDILRMYLMKKTDYVWVDLDMYCVRPLGFDSDYLFGKVKRKRSMNNCILRLPKDSLALQLITNFYQTDIPLPFWLGEKHVRSVIDRLKEGRRLTLYDLPWTTTGPSLAAWALNLTGEMERGQHWHVFFPKSEFLDPELEIEEYEADWVRFHHFQGRTRSKLLREHAGIPPKGSYIDMICKRHGIDPAEYPIHGL